MSIPGSHSRSPQVSQTMRFGPLMIDYNDQVLRPRAWTFAQATWAADLARTAPPGPVLELCAGAGQIGLTVARVCADRGERRELVMIDANPHACALARRNGSRARLRCEVREGKLQHALLPDESFSVIVADPPWVPSAMTSRYPEDPLWAIDGGDDGLAVARVCIAVIGMHLRRRGFAVLQLGTKAQIEVLQNDMDAGLDLVGHRLIPGANGALMAISRL